MKRWAPWLLLLLVPLLAGCGTTIPAGSRGLANNAFGKPGLQEEVKSEGYYFQWPWNSIIVYDVTWQTRAEKVETLTADDLHVPTVVSVTYRPRAEELHRLQIEIGPNYYGDVIRPQFVTLVRNAFSEYEHNDLARKSPAIEQEVASRLVQVLEPMPIEVGTVAVEHINFDRNVTNAISNKLIKEQQAEQKIFEITIAEHDAVIARTTAQGVGDAIRIQAEGEARAIVIKAEAQSKAQQMIATTLTKDYLQYKAFDGDTTRYYFVPIGKDGMPLIVSTE